MSYPDPTKPHRTMNDRWMVHPADCDYLPPAKRWCIICTKLNSDPIHTQPTRTEA